MTLGEKIRKIRTERRMTQAALCGDKITRNMLSAIECGKAMPSLDTVYFLAEGLGIPASYLLSDDDDLFFYAKRSVMKHIKAAYKAKKYQTCIDYIVKLGTVDDELSFILGSCYFELGRRCVYNGSVNSAKKYISLAKEFCEKTIYDTERMENLMLLYSALAENIQAPLLEFDRKSFESTHHEINDYEFYKYVIGDTLYPFTNSFFSNHIKARELMNARRYKDALSLLLQIENERTAQSYNAHLIFGVYTDIESCYKQLMDFENAYRYSSKRMSLIEGFKS